MRLGVLLAVSMAAAGAHQPVTGSALDIPAEPVTGCQSPLARFARQGPLYGSPTLVARVPGAQRATQRVQNSPSEPYSGPDSSTQPAVATEFRVFAAAEEITHTTRIRIMPTGTRDNVVTVEPDKHLRMSLPTGIYDVQALRLRQEAIAAIKWTERVVVMHYPDEGGRHLEVINFDPGYGALQVRASKGSIADYEVAIFPAGDRESPTGHAAKGDDYLLFILAAGHYDIRVRRAGDPSAEGARWFLDVEVPADRTRLKQID